MNTLLLLAVLSSAPDRLAADLAPRDAAAEARFQLELQLEDQQHRRPTAALYAFPAPLLLAGTTGLLLTALIESFDQNVADYDARTYGTTARPQTSSTAGDIFGGSLALIAVGAAIELAIWRFVIHPFDVRIESLSQALGRD